MKDFFKNTLFVSPNYRRRKGGIASVIDLYSQNLKSNFNYVPSIYFENIYLSAVLFPVNLIHLNLVLFFNKKIKIIHIHGSHGGSFIRKSIIYWICKKIYNKKIIYHIHSSHFHKFYEESSVAKKKKIKNVIESIDLLIVLSEEWKIYFESNFKAKKVKILENIVARRPGEINFKSYSNTKLDLLFLGRIGQRKGIFDLLEAISKSEFKNDIRLSIGGDGDIDKLNKYIKREDYSVEYLGWVSGQKKFMLLEKADIFVLPSYDEGLPISLLEAMSYGKPIISTPVGGIPRILKDNYNGFLVTPGNKKEIRNAIAKYIDNPKLKTNHGKNGASIVEDYYPENVLSKLNQMYLELI